MENKGQHLNFKDTRKSVSFILEWLSTALSMPSYILLRFSFRSEFLVGMELNICRKMETEVRIRTLL